MDFKRSAIGGLIAAVSLLPAPTVTDGAGLTGQSDCVPVPAGLVAWWPGDGHADDLSGNDLHGAIVGAGVTFGAGIVGQAFQFDNQNGKVLVGHSALLDSTQALTIEAWVQPWVPPLQNLGYVFDHAGAIHVGGGYALTMQAFHGDTAFGGVHISHGPGNNWDALYSAAMPVNAWYHLVGAYDAAALRYRFYVNGQDLAGTGRDLLTPDPINYYQQLDLAIGNRLTAQGGIDRGFYGLIDEVRVFDRALSEQEVLAIYQAGESGVCKAIAVSIDIKPGHHPNSIQLDSNGVVAVGIFSSASFDATTVDPTTVRLAGAAVGLKGKGTPMASFVDLNGDGRVDLVVHVSTEALQLSDGDTEAELTGRTFDGRAIAGVDSVRIVSSFP